MTAASASCHAASMYFSSPSLFILLIWSSLPYLYSTPGLHSTSSTRSHHCHLYYSCPSLLRLRVDALRCHHPVPTLLLHSSLPIGFSCLDLTSILDRSKLEIRTHAHDDDSNIFWSRNLRRGDIFTSISHTLTTLPGTRE